MIVLTVNPSNLSRVAESYHYWGKDFSELFKKSIIRYATPLDLPFEPDLQFISYWNNSISHIQNYLFQYIQNLHDFYYSTNLDWVIRTTEDCFVDIRQLGRYIEDLSRFKDPKKDLIIKGHLVRSSVIVNSTNLEFLHGGSGWIISRAMAKYILDNKEELISLMFTGTNKGDDILTFDLINRLKLTSMEVQSYSFLGVPLTDESMEALQYGRFNKIPNCDFSADPLQYTFSFNKIIFWHNGKADSFTNNNGFRLISETPDEIKVQTKGLKAELCFYGQNSHTRSILRK